MLKRIIGVPVIVLLSMTQAFAQLYTGTTGLYIKSGATITTDSLTLTPSSDLDITDITITRSSIAVQGISGLSIEQVYNLSAPLIFQGTAGLYYNTSQLNGNAAATLTLAYNDVPSGSWVTTSGTTVNTGTNYLSETFSTPIELSGITATTFGVILPITLVNFTASAENAGVHLNWEMNTTDKTTFCEVQHAANGKHFVTLEQVPLMEGNHKYNLYHSRPVQGMNFYRLRWKNETGIEKFSAVQSVLFNSSQQQGLTLYPLPVQDILHLNMPDIPRNGSYVTLSAIDGKILIRKDLTAKTVSLELQQYPSGVYILTYYCGASAKHYKIDKH